MKSIFLGALISLVGATAAHADNFKCVFTEPFFTLEYSMVQQSLKTTSPEDSSVAKNISFQIKGPSDFALMDAEKNVVVELKLTQNGSDGMSDRRYPYEAKWNGLIGGCESNFLKATGE